MTNDVTIRVENLSKRYRIGEHVSYRNLRETITECLKKPFRSSSGSDRSHGGGFQDDGYIWALKEISMEVKAGEVVGIIGPNGAGKSTLLKILSRITKPTTGYAEIHGRAGSLLEVGTGFHPELTGRENIYLNSAVLGMRKNEIKQKYDEIVDFAEIGKFIDTPVKRYSSGMYVRLAFSVAAHMEPKILLVDEVLAVGDLAFQKKCLGKMENVAKEGRTVLFVSHHLFAIRTLCHRTAWLDGGQITEIGPTFEVVRNYEEKVLKSSGKISPVVERRFEQTDNYRFHIQHIKMFDSQGHPSAIFSYQSSFFLILHLAGECSTDQFAVEFRIHKDSGEYACTGVSSLFHDIHFDKRTRDVRIDIGPLILTNGHYNMSFRILTQMSIADIWDNACSFNIIECNPFTMRREIKTPVCVVQHSFHPLG